MAPALDDASKCPRCGRGRATHYDVAEAMIALKDRPGKPGRAATAVCSLCGLSAMERPADERPAGNT